MCVCIYRHLYFLWRVQAECLSGFWCFVLFYPKGVALWTVMNPGPAYLCQPSRNGRRVEVGMCFHLLLCHGPQSVLQPFPWNAGDYCRNWGQEESRAAKKHSPGWKMFAIWEEWWTRALKGGLDLWDPPQEDFLGTELCPFIDSHIPQLPISKISGLFPIFCSLWQCNIG